MKTLGELVEALDGELEIIVHRMEDCEWSQSNDHAYAGYNGDIPLKEGRGTVHADTASLSKLRRNQETGSSAVGKVSVVSENG